MDAVLLARVSSREQAEGMSIDAQTENLRNYCARKGLNVSKTFQLVESSTKSERKKFEEMLRYVGGQPNKVALVADTIDRVQRSFKESVELDELRKADKIEIHFIRENLVIHKDSNSSEIARWDLGVFTSKTYVGNLRDNVKRSISFNTSKGIWQSQAPIGYKNIRDGNNRPTIVPDPERDFKIRRLFELYASGLYTLGEMVMHAKEMGLTSRQNHVQLPKASIQNILQNPFYYGVMVVKGQLYKHIYKPIIDKDLFDKCQAVMHQKASKRQKYAKIPFAFGGLIRCAECGCAISGDTKVKPNGKTYTYLKCSHYKGNCHQAEVNEQRIFDQLQTEVFDKLTIPQEMMQQIVDSLRASVQAEKEFLTQSLNDLNTRLERANDKKSRLLDVFLNQSITQTEYDKKRSEIEKEIFDIQAQMQSHIVADTTFVTTVESVFLVVSKAGELFKSSKVEQKRALLNLLLSNCTLKDGTLQYSLNKPFDALVNLAENKKWLGIVDDLRTVYYADIMNLRPSLNVVVESIESEYGQNWRTFTNQDTRSRASL